MSLTLFERVRKGYERYYLWEVSWRLNKTATYWPPNSSGYSSISFSFSWAAQPGAWGEGSVCWVMVHIPASSLQLIWTSCHRGYIIIWHPPTSCERHNSHSIQPFDSQGCPLISSTGCTCYLHTSAWLGSICNTSSCGYFLLFKIKTWCLGNIRELWRTCNLINVSRRFQALFPVKGKKIHQSVASKENHFVIKHIKQSVSDHSWMISNSMYWQRQKLSEFWHKCWLFDCVIHLILLCCSFLFYSRLQKVLSWSV